MKKEETVLLRVTSIERYILKQAATLDGTTASELLRRLARDYAKSIGLWPATLPEMEAMTKVAKDAAKDDD